MASHNLFIQGANGAAEPATTEQILAAARQVLAHRVRRGATLNSPQKVLEYLSMRLGHLDHEVFGLILAKQAAACLLVHNHPSQVGDFSHADEIITKRLKEILQGIEVRILDHLLVAGGTVVSMAELGRL